MSTSFGLTSGFLCHYWYIFLDRSVVGGTGLSLVARCKDYTIVSSLNVCCVPLILGYLQIHKTILCDP